MPRNSKTALPPLYEPGAYIREHARIADGKKQTAPQFSDHYEKGITLGEGRYSQVYAAKHKETGAKRAVKTAIRRGPNTKIVDLGMECPGRLARHEADILKSLDHPNVVRLYEVYEEAEAVHIVLELCEGSDVLERILVSKGRLPEQEISLLFVQMLFATRHLHCRGVIHRDLKPEHFLFTRKEEDRGSNPPKVASLKVIDFGLSHREGAAFIPLGGTPQFMPPEIIHGQAPNKATADRVDMWALGVVLHAMLVGHYPSPHLSDKTQKQYFAKPAWNSISEPCLNLLGDLLKHNVDKRPSSYDALKHTWAKTAVELRGAPGKALVQALPREIRGYCSLPGLQRLALVAVAHDLDDFDYYGLRLLFQAMLQKSDGNLTRTSLETLAQAGGDEGKIAEALTKFTPLGASGDKDTAIDWTEFLAVVAMGGIRKATTKEDTTEGMPNINADESDVCMKAFDLLSLGSGELNGSALELLFARAPPEPESAGRAAEGAQSEPVPYDDLVRELFPATGSVSRKHFSSLLKGEVKPKVGGGFLSCLSCGSKQQSGSSDANRV